MADNDNFSFDPGVVKEKMTAIEGKFAEFAKVLQEINNTMEMNVNKDEDSAVFGKCGAAELSAWSDNASTFGDFYNNFNNWSALVSAVSANNIALQNDVISKYRSTGNKLDGVAEARAASSADGLSEDAKKVYGHLIPDNYVPTNEEYMQAKKQGDIPDDWTYEDYKKYIETGESPEGKTPIASTGHVPTGEEFMQAKKQGDIPDDWTYEDYKNYLKTGESPEGKTPIASSDGAPTSEEFTQAKKQGDIPDDWTYEDYKKYMETGESPEGKTPITPSETEPTQATDSNGDTETTSTTETTEETEPEGEVSSTDETGSTEKNPTSSKSSFKGASAGTELNLPEGNAHSGKSNNLAIPTNFDEMKEAMENEQPFVLSDGNSIFDDRFGAGMNNGEFKADGSDRYFVYDADTKRYYECDENGSLVGTRPSLSAGGLYIDPENFIKGTNTADYIGNNNSRFE